MEQNIYINHLVAVLHIHRFVHPDEILQSTSAYNQKDNYNLKQKNISKLNNLLN